MQPANIETLCHSVVVVAQNHCPAALHQAMAIETTYKKVLHLFYECHHIYDGGAISDDKIDTLGNHK